MTSNNHEHTNAPPDRFSEEVKRTLVYYDLFNYPLTAQQLFTFFPSNSLTFDEFYVKMQNEFSEKNVSEKDGYVFLSEQEKITLRKQNELNAVKMMRIAQWMTHIIKRFPFVRGVFLSGELSKNVSSADGDIDFMIVTKKDRLWICRTFLVLFKKIFLFNKKKYFCINYFIDEEHLTLDEQNIFTATEIAHLKPFYNFELFTEYMKANGWLKKFFPNYSLSRMNIKKFKSRKSFLQRLLELPFSGKWAITFDKYLMKKSEKIWKSRYPQFDELTRKRLFRCDTGESRVFPLNFEDKVLTRYEQRLHQFGITPKPSDIQRNHS